MITSTKTNENLCGTQLPLWVEVPKLRRRFATRRFWNCCKSLTYFPIRAFGWAVRFTGAAVVTGIGHRGLRIGGLHPAYTPSKTVGRLAIGPTTRWGEFASPMAWIEVNTDTAAVLLANAAVMRALIALASKLADR